LLLPNGDFFAGRQRQPGSSHSKFPEINFLFVKLLFAMKREAAYLRKNQNLLRLAESKADSAQVEWRSHNLGSWKSLQPKWQLAGSRIRFYFHCAGNRVLWVHSIKPKPWGMSILLSDSRSPIPEEFKISWRQSFAEDLSFSSWLWEVVLSWLRQNYPANRILWAAKRSDLWRGLSGRFLRVLFRHNGRTLYLLAADKEACEEAPLALGQALLWISRTEVNRTRAAPLVHILVPSGSALILNHRRQYVNRRRVDVKVWEYEGDFGNYRINRSSELSSPVEDKDFRWPVLGPFRWSAKLEQVLHLAPDLIRRYPRFQDYDSLRLWGLEFAQAIGVERDRIHFGVGSPRMELTEDNFEILRSLVNEILFYRRADSPDTKHPFYRLQAERWLEALILENIPEIFPEMSSESVYSQIPVYIGKDPGRIDILGADRQGTLVVIELKVTADSDLPLQALDYWGRVIRHNENGDFERRGYFSEVRLNRRQPRIYLVSPVFSFHDSTESLLRYLDPGLEVWKISINEDWRSGVRVLRRISYRCEDLP
jgi:hypothetical protein